MSTIGLRELVNDHAFVMPLTVDQYQSPVIVNLPDRVVEVYTEPSPGKHRYARTATLLPRQTLELAASKGRRVRVPVHTMLP